MTDSRQTLPANIILDASYRILRVVGSGGFGITYEAEDINLGTVVAIKEYYPEEFGDRDASNLHVKPRSDRHRKTFEWGRLNFAQEARTLARFEHPSIVRVLRVFEANSTAYMVMRSEQGRNFDDWLASIERLPTQEEMDRIAGPLLDALELMHASNFFHRDIAPDNIIIRADATPVLLDFGAARRAVAEASRSITGIIKAGYSPPEQYATDARLQGPWTDIYAFGATLYRAVTGKVPEESTLRVIDDRMLPAMSVGEGKYRPNFLEAIDACLEVHHADRPQSVAQVRSLLLTLPAREIPPPARDATALRIEKWKIGPTGDVLRAQGDLPGALEAYSTSLAITDRLAKADPGNTVWQRDLSVAQERIGKLLRSLGNSEEVKKALRVPPTRPSMNAWRVFCFAAAIAIFGGGLFGGLQYMRWQADERGRLEALAKRNTEEEQLAAEKKAAEERALKEAEARREAQAAAAKKKAEDEAIAKAQAEAEAERKAEEERALRARWEADQARRRAEADEARRKIEEQAKQQIPISPPVEIRVLTAEKEQRIAPGQEFQECKDCPRMVVVPAGEFTMGSPASEAERSEGETQVHVTIARPFAVGKFSVTFEEWDACVTDGGCNSYRPGDQGWGRSKQPVINVNWYDAKVYAAWLSQKTGKSYRLLSEAEREYVARAGTTTPFWWESWITPKQANYDGSVEPYKGGGSRGEYRQRTVPVDSFEANSWGLYQVHGNVWEWTEDCWNDSNAGNPGNGSARTSGNCRHRVRRGGSWLSHPRALRAADRSVSGIGSRDSGFRLARTLARRGNQAADIQVPASFDLESAKLLLAGNRAYFRYVARWETTPQGVQFWRNEEIRVTSGAGLSTEGRKIIEAWISKKSAEAPLRIAVRRQPAVATPTPPPARCDGVEALVGSERHCLKPKDSFKDCDTCPEMVVVPAGSFTMGSPVSESERSGEETQVHVTIARPFAAGKFAVTFDEWDACVADGGCNGYRPGDQGWGRSKQPVINVNWNDAKAYAAWLSQKTGKSYRLLSEAEREYVACAGTTTPFWWGPSITPKQANYDGSVEPYKGGGSKGEYRQRTVPVDSFEANPWGLYQVHGNVWEWTEDCWNDSNAGNPGDGSARTSGDCRHRTRRGGSWLSYPRDLRTSARGWSNIGFRAVTGGFRLARTLGAELNGGRLSEAAEAWAAVKDTTSIPALEAFIARFPDTFHADLARTRITELKKQVEAEAKRKAEEEAKREKRNAEAKQRRREEQATSGYVAVLASKTSRTDALKAFADLQQKYGDVLASKTPNVQEANLGDKGVRYRAFVGPPGSREAASEVCKQLKTAGYNDCWVTAY